MKAIAGDNSRYFQISSPDDLYPQFNNLFQKIAVCPAVSVVPVTVGKSLFWLILVKYFIKKEIWNYYNYETICKYYSKYYPTPILKYKEVLFHLIEYHYDLSTFGQSDFPFVFISIISLLSTKFPQLFLWTRKRIYISCFIRKYYTLSVLWVDVKSSMVVSMSNRIQACYVF